jgi:hypothetical protein
MADLLVLLPVAPLAVQAAKRSNLLCADAVPLEIKSSRSPLATNLAPGTSLEQLGFSFLQRYCYTGCANLPIDDLRSLRSLLFSVSFDRSLHIDTLFFYELLYRSVAGVAFNPLAVKPNDSGRVPPAIFAVWQEATAQFGVRRPRTVLPTDGTGPLPTIPELVYAKLGERL